MTYRILITGSRTWTDRSLIRDVLKDAHRQAQKEGHGEIILVSGACPKGADRMCEEIWEANGLLVEKHPADWEKYPGRAGYIRNAEMVDLGANLCLAFIKDHSKGGSMTASLAEKANIPTRRYEQ